MIKTFDNENTLSQNLALEIFKELKNKKISIIPEKYYSGKEIVKILLIKKRKILNDLGKSLSSLIGLLINTIDPDKLVLGGEVIINNIDFKKILIKNIHKYILADEVKKISIKTSKLKDNTGLLGAGLLFR